MKYISTRGEPTGRHFSEILLEGLAPDGGLYLPTHYPKVDDATLARWRGLYGNGRPGGYADLAFEILSLYIDDIPAADLKALAHRTYTAATFGTEAIVPVRRLEPGLYIEGLSNGPTLAFKDMAMQLLGNLFEYELARRGEQLNILGATSGDTGSAAEYAMRGKRGVRVFMLSPQGRMSPFQQAQMFSLQDPNIHNIAVEGVFDDCQDIVKAASNDLDFKRRHRIGTVNSINWARLLAQVVYYFAGYFQVTKSNSEPVSFAVPSGNFGNVCAGHVARMMGLPIARLVVATNENDVLDEFFRSGRYRVRAAAETYETSSPSMDISKASNFERFVFDLLGRDGRRVAQLFGAGLAKDGGFQLTPGEFERIEAFGFVSGKSTHADRLAAIRSTWEDHGDMIDTHTADGLKVAREHLQPGVAMVVLETALPAKFAATIAEALGREPLRPAALVGIEDLPRRFTVMAADAAQVKAYIERHCRA
ncbi:MAG: threonine synthase [Burkholderiaceae bacterium]|nr:threonine synthase [Burkholderiaceae bacterium]